MDDEDIIVEGARIVSSNIPPAPCNPLNRPEVSYKKPIAVLLCFCILTFAVVMLSVFVDRRIAFAQAAVVVLFIIFFGKKSIIWFIHLYQKKASDEVRLRCVFEPSCSEYMILALNKYGLLRGLKKGINRLNRCHHPNGGKDYP